LGRVGDRDRLAGQEERAVQIFVDERLSAEALGKLGGFRIARLAALEHREYPSDDGCGKQNRDSRK
jgi:hypothetical protein